MKAYDFLTQKKVLLLCEGPFTKAAIKRAFVSKGARPENIHTAKTIEEAYTMMQQQVFEVVVADYQFQNHYGLELAETHRAYPIPNSEKIFMIIANSGEAQAVADAADEEIDAYAIKPFVESDLVARIEKIISHKVKPSEKSKILTQAKVFIQEGNLLKARQLLITSVNYVDAPAILFYTLGKMDEDEGKLESALGYYFRGLEFSPDHYKCLSGYFLALYKLGKKTAALETLTKITAKYPVSPEVLKYGFCVVIESYKFEEVERYYQIYINLLRKPDDLKVVVSASLLAAGKMILRKRPELVEQAHDYFTKGAVISGRDENYLCSIIKELIKEKQTEKINRYFDMIEAEGERKQITLPLRLKQYLIEGRDSITILNLGKEILNEGFANENICFDLLDFAKKTGSENRVYEIATRATALFPNLREEFARFL